MATNGFTFPDKEQVRQREIAAHISALHSPLANIRIAALRRLGEMRAGVDEVLASLRDPNDAVRSAAAMALGSYAGDPLQPVIIDDLLAAIDDPNARVCQAAIRSLGLLRAEVARQEIEEFLEDSNDHIAGASILALARLSTEESGESNPRKQQDRFELGQQLAEYLYDESSYVRMQAVRAVGILKYTPAAPVITDLLRKTREARQAAQQQALIDPQVHEDEHYTLQNYLIRTVGELRYQESIPILLEIAQKDIGLRGLAVEALISIGAEIAPELLTGLLHDPSVFLRRRLILLVAQFNYTPALPVLRPLLKDENATTRGAALQALTQLNDPEALPDIQWIALYDTNPFLRVQAVNSLAEIQGPEAGPLLLSLAADPNFEVRRAVVDHLLQWGLTSEPALVALARYAHEAPEDDRSQLIAQVLEDHPDIPYPAESNSACPETVELPEIIRAERSTLLNYLESWLESISLKAETPRSDPENFRTMAALKHLIDLLHDPQ